MVRLLLVFGFLIACGDDQEEVVDDCAKIVKAFKEEPACQVEDPWNSEVCMFQAKKIDSYFKAEFDAMSGEDKLACTKRIESSIKAITKTSQKKTIEELVEEREVTVDRIETVMEEPVEPEPVVTEEEIECVTVNGKLLPDAPDLCEAIYPDRLTQEEWDEMQREAEEGIDRGEDGAILTYDQPIERGIRALTNPDIPTVIVEHEAWREGTARVGCRRRSDGQVFYVLDRYHDKGVSLHLALKLVLGTGCAAGYDLVR